MIPLNKLPNWWALKKELALHPVILDQEQWRKLWRKHMGGDIKADVNNLDSGSDEVTLEAKEKDEQRMIDHNKLRSWSVLREELALSNPILSDEEWRKLWKECYRKHIAPHTGKADLETKEQNK